MALNIGFRSMEQPTINYLEIKGIKQGIKSNDPKIGTVFKTWGGATGLVCSQNKDDSYNVQVFVDNNKELERRISKTQLVHNYGYKPIFQINSIKQ